jgi:hypothetical protein
MMAFTNGGGGSVQVYVVILQLKGCAVHYPDSLQISGPQQEIWYPRFEGL